MKGPVPIQEPIKNHRRDQSPISPSRTLTWPESGQWVAQSSYSPLAVRFWVQGNQPAFRGMVRGSSPMIPSRVQGFRTGRTVEPELNLQGEGGGAIQSIRELSEDYRVPIWGEKYLGAVLERNNNDVQVLDQTLAGYVSFIQGEDCTRVQREIKDAFILPPAFSLDCGRIAGEGIAQGVCPKRRSAQLRSQAQNFGSWGRTPVHRWNRHE